MPLFFINENEKAAIVGLNGAGKTTLLKMLAKEYEVDTGSISITKDAKLGYLKQINDISSDRSIIDEMYTVISHILDMEKKISYIEEKMKALSGKELDELYDEYNKITHQYELLEGYIIKSKVNGILKGLGFNENEFDKKVSLLSGGQKTRLFLAKLLLSSPDIILLDEPTNHLDLSSIEWLENYLLNYKKAVIIVSHDRYFLDKIVTKVIDIDNTKVNVYSGNYSDFSEKKESIRQANLKAYLNQEKFIKHQEEVIEKLRSFNREKSIKRARSREKLLDKTQRLDKPSELKSDMQLEFMNTDKSGFDVLSVKNLSKGFDNVMLFENLSFDIKRGEHVAIMGDNGSGKTTILKILNRLLPADSGSIDIGSGVKISYYDQEHQVLDMEKSLFEELSDAYPEMSNTQIRNTLASFLFFDDDVFKKIKNLSGGERGRLSLAKLMLGSSNLIILDEPTNHLDMVSKEILENAINKFSGTIIYVSHDRYFINKTATRILHLKNKVLYNYIGNYDYYLEKKADVEAALPNNTADIIPKENERSNSSKDTWQAQKEKAAIEKKKKNSIEKLEKEIEEIENSLDEINNKFLDTAIQTNLEELLKLQKKKDELDEKLTLLYEKWEELSYKE